MSTWIYVTTLPGIFDELALQEVFKNIVQPQNIKAIHVTKDTMLGKSTGFVQFYDAKDAKQAASYKDQVVIDNCAIRVYLVWDSSEDLSTIKVTNIPNQCTANDLKNAFENFGNIVDIKMAKGQNNTNSTDAKLDSSIALISFCRVDYALRAVQEMNGSILGMGSALCVELANPDARVECK